MISTSKAAWHEIHSHVFFRRIRTLQPLMPNRRRQRISRGHWSSGQLATMSPVTTKRTRQAFMNCTNSPHPTPSENWGGFLIIVSCNDMSPARLQLDSIPRGSNQVGSYGLTCTIRPLRLPPEQSRMMKKPISRVKTMKKKSGKGKIWMDPPDTSWISPSMSTNLASLLVP